MRKTKTKKAISLVLTLMFALSIFAVVPAQEAEASTKYSTLPVRNLGADECFDDVNLVTVEVDKAVLEPKHDGRTFRLDMSIPAGFDSEIEVTSMDNVANITPTEATGRTFEFFVTVGDYEQEVEEVYSASVFQATFGGRHNFYVSSTSDNFDPDLFSINYLGECDLDGIIDDEEEWNNPAPVEDGEINIPIGELPANFSIVFWELVEDEDPDSDTFGDNIPVVLECENVQRADGYYNFEWTTGEDVFETITYDPNKNLKFTIDFKELCVPAGFTGDINATFSSPPEDIGDLPGLGTIFDGATVLIARVAVGDVMVSVPTVNFITDSNIENNIGALRFTEEFAGAMRSDSLIKLKLPRGFYWDSNLLNDSVNFTGRFGVASGEVDVTLEDPADLLRTKWRTLVVSAPDGLDETRISSWQIDAGELRIIVDPRLAERGDVMAAVSGTRVNATPSEVLVARYGDYVATPEALSEPNRLAGKMNQRLGSFELREDIAGSLLFARTISLTLPEGAKWIPGTEPFVDEFEDVKDEFPLLWEIYRLLMGEFWLDDYSFIVDPANAPKLDVGESTIRNFKYGIGAPDPVTGEPSNDQRWVIVDAERRTIRTTVTEQSSHAGRSGAHLVFEHAGRVAIEPTFRGELTVTVGGTAGAAGEIDLAYVWPAVEAEEVDPVQIIAGQPNQELPNIVLTESLSGAASRTGETTGIISLQVPDPRYATFSQRPTAEVTDGDMVIERIWMSADRTAVNIQVVASSDEASTIEVSDLMVTLDRAVPYGDFNLQLGGDALIDDPIPTRLYFLDSDVLQEIKVATVVDEITPVEVMMWIGSTTYTIDGVAGEMDVAPFIENDRTFVPVRFIAQGFGVSEDDIDWGPQDELTEWVTIEHDGKLITITIGDPVIVVEEDGVTTTVLSDVAAQIINDRTYLPIRAVGEILGAEFDWGPKETLTEWVSFTYWK